MAKKVHRCAIYGRVSVDEAAEVEHGSLEQQQHLCRDLAAQLSRMRDAEYRVDYILIEERGVSGGNTNRPKFQALLDLVRSRRIDAVLAKEISRIARSIKDFCEFMEVCRANTVAVHIRGLDLDPNTPMGELMFKMLALIAEFERKLIVQRTKDSIRSAMLNNSKINGGSLPLGFDFEDTK
jgi:DNA invertase Pin-like site-specific DNA recombinase